MDFEGLLRCICYDCYEQTIYIISGFTFYLAFSAPKTGQKNRLDDFLTKCFDKDISVTLKYDVGSFTIHLHHWLYLSMIGSFCYYFKLNENIVPFFCIGGAIQGIVSYHDWYHIITPNDKCVISCITKTAMLTSNL